MRRSITSSLLVLGLAAAARAAAPANSCVACHRGAKEVPSLGHTFEEWSESAHAAAGVNCEACHGGDPTKAKPAEAHAGIRPASDPKSRTYYTAIPATCGACHEPEFAAFRESRHYEELVERGRGPDCLSCHGAMADTVLEPRYMEMTCTLCHHPPMRAYDARMALEEARAAVAAAKGDAALRKRLEALVIEWHSFDVEKVLARAEALKRDARKKRAPKP